MKKDKASSDKVIRYIFIGLMILWTGFIFSNSLQTASESLDRSGIFVTFFINMTKVVYGDNIPLGLTKYIELHLVEHIRNLAHIFEFFVLFIFARESIKLFKKIQRNAALAFIYGLIVMAIDETIQIFVDGRGFQIKDLALDTLGMILALTTIVIVNYFRFKNKKSKYDN